MCGGYTGEYDTKIKEAVERIREDREGIGAAWGMGRLIELGFTLLEVESILEEEGL